MPEEYPVPAGPADHCRVGCRVEGGVLNMEEASPDVGAGLLGLGEDLLEFGDAVVADELEPSKFRAELPAYELSCQFEPSKRRKQPRPGIGLAFVAYDA